MTYVGHLNRTTGLYIQSMFETLMTHEVLRAQRYPDPLAILRLNLYFTAPPNPVVLENATVIAAVALNSHLRDADIPGHYDEDFVALLPATDETGALVAAGRLQKILKGSHVATDGSYFDLATCIGVAGFPAGEVGEAETLMTQVSAALAEAKRRGPHAMVKFSELESKA